MIFLDIFSGFDAYETSYLIGAVIGVFAIFLIPAIFYLLTLQNTLKAIHPLNRMMQPGNVWLMFIPLFNLVWMFIMISRIADSIKNELNARGSITTDRPTYGVGLAWCILFLMGRFVSTIQPLGAPLSLAGLICWIIHWVKVNEYKKQFLAEPYEPVQDSQIFGHL